MKNKYIIITSTILILTGVIFFLLKTDKNKVPEVTYEGGSTEIDLIVDNITIDDETQELSSGLYRYIFSSDTIPEDYKNIIKTIHETAGIECQNYYIYDEVDGKRLVLIDSCEECYISVK